MPPTQPPTIAPRFEADEDNGANTVTFDGNVKLMVFTTTDGDVSLKPIAVNDDDIGGRIDV